MLIPLLSAGNFVIGMGAFVVIGILPPLADGLGVSNGAAGGALTAYALAYAIGSPLGVALTGALPRRQLLCAAMAVFGIAAFLSSLAGSIEALYAARVLAALGAGCFTPIAAAVAATAAPPERRGAALANVFLGLTLAQVLGVPAGAWVAYSVGWQAAFAMVAALSVPILWGLWRLVPADLPFQPTRLSALGTALKDPRQLLAVGFTAALLAAIYVLYTYLAPLLETKMGYGRDGISFVLLVFGAGAVIGNVIGGRLSDRFGPARTLSILTVLQILIMPLFFLLPLPGFLLLGLVLVWSVFGWSFMAPQQVRLVTLVPESQNVILALNAAAIYVGAAIGSSLGALVVAHLGLGAVGPVAGITAVVAAGMLWLSARLEKSVDNRHLSD